MIADDLHEEWNTILDQMTEDRTLTQEEVSHLAQDIQIFVLKLLARIRSSERALNECREAIVRWMRDFVEPAAKKHFEKPG